MAKLYAELSSDKGGRHGTKAGNKEVVVHLYVGNSLEYTVVHKPHSLLVYDSDHNILVETRTA